MGYRARNQGGTFEYICDAEADLATITNPRASEFALALAEGTLWFHSGTEWTQCGGAAGASDHGDLTGLADDDHTQYATNTEFDDHSARHENGGADEISLAGLDGTPTDLQTHLDDTADAHDASAISIADAGGDFTATTVEGALDELQADNEAHTAAADPHTGYVLESLIDAAGDLIIGSADNTPARLARGRDNQVLTANATTIGWEDAAGGSITADALTTDLISSTMYAYEDFLQQQAVAVDGDPWGPGRVSLTGTGSSVAGVSTTHAAVGASHPGIVQCSTGTTTVGASGYKIGPLTVGTGRIRCGAWVRAEDLSDGTNTYYIGVGLDTGVPSALTNCVQLRYSSAVNSGAWQAVTDNTAGTTTDAADDNGGAVTVVADTWYKVEVEINAAGTSAEFFVNDVSKATLTTNIPTGGGDEDVFFQVVIKKTAGTTARLMYIDAYYLLQEFTTSR